MINSKLRKYLLTEKEYCDETEAIKKDVSVTGGYKCSPFLAEGIRYYASKGARFNSIIVGTAGSGKTRRYAKGHLLEMDGSYVINDVRGEILKSTGKLLQENGYKIRVLNLADCAESHHYNPIDYIYDANGLPDPKKAEMIVEGLILNQEPDMNIRKSDSPVIENNDFLGDPFWQDLMRHVLLFGILFVAEFMPTEKRDLYGVADFLDMIYSDNNGKIYQNYVVQTALRKNKEAVCFKDRFYKMIIGTPPRTMTQIIMAVCSIISAFRRDVNAEAWKMTARTIYTFGADSNAKVIFENFNKLTVEESELINMRFYELNSYAEIAKKLRLKDADAARDLQSKVIKKLRSGIDPYLQNRFDLHSCDKNLNINPYEVCDQKTVIFIIPPNETDGEKTLALSAILYRQVSDAVQECEAQQYPVHLIIDEPRYVGKIPYFENMIVTINMRKSMDAMVLTQSLFDFVHVYPAMTKEYSLFDLFGYMVLLSTYDVYSIEQFVQWTKKCKAIRGLKSFPEEEFKNMLCGIKKDYCYAIMHGYKKPVVAKQYTGNQNNKTDEAVDNKESEYFDIKSVLVDENNIPLSSQKRAFWLLHTPYDKVEKSAIDQKPAVTLQDLCDFLGCSKSEVAQTVLGIIASDSNSQ